MFDCSSKKVQNFQFKFAEKEFFGLFGPFHLANFTQTHKQHFGVNIDALEKKNGKSTVQIEFISRAENTYLAERLHIDHADASITKSVPVARVKRLTKKG